MTITADTPVVGVAPRMSRAAFVGWLQSVNSPAANEAGGGYDLIVANHVDPLFLAAAFWHESNAATNPKSVDVRYGTMSPGNTRTSRTGKGTVIQTDRGQFVKYASWRDGWEDMAFRLVDPSYVYSQQGCTTPATIIPKFAPESDGNDPNGYLQSVIAFMQQHQSTDSGGNVADIWYPPAKRSTSPYQNPGASSGRTWPSNVTDVVMHHTAGSYQSAVNYFAAPGRGNAGTSAHFVISRSGEVTQVVPLDCVAWHAGNWDENVRSVGIEHEQSQNADGSWQDWPDALLNASAALLVWLKARMGGFNVYPHSRFTSTGCPGDLPISEIVKRMDGAASPAAKESQTPATAVRIDPVTGFELRGGMRAYYELLESKLGPDETLLLVGRPISNEFVDADGVTRQAFERQVWEWRKGSRPSQFDILGLRLGADWLTAHSLPKSP